MGSAYGLKIKTKIKKKIKRKSVGEENMPNETRNLPAVTYYTPTELIGLYRSYFERGKTNTVVWLRGIYRQRPNQNQQWATAFDELHDVDTNNSVTLKINWNDRGRLKDNSLVMIGGLIDISSFASGMIQIALHVTRFEIIKDQFVTEEDMKRIELRQRKTASRFKNVDMEIGQVLFEGKRPRIALVIAENTKTQGDFEDGLRSARTAIVFDEFKMPLTQTQNLCNVLRRLDAQGYTAIAIYRGGGIDSKQDVDKIEVLEVVVGMRTPFISGVGHKPESIFLRQVADAWTCTPQGLGQYFSEIVENVAAKRNNSKAALVKEVEGQFKKQIEESNQKNKELQEKLTALTKNQVAAQKQQTEQTKQLTNLQEQLKKQADSLKTQTDNLTKLQTANSALNKSVQELTVRHSLTTKERDSAQEKVRQLEGKLNGKKLIYVAIFLIAIVIGIAIAKMVDVEWR